MIKCEICEEEIKAVILICKQQITENIWRTENFHEQCYVESMISQINKINDKMEAKHGNTH